MFQPESCNNFLYGGLLASHMMPVPGCLDNSAPHRLKRDMLIITGTGRCGTATLARILGGHHEFRVQYLLEKYFLRADPFSDPFRDIQKRIEAMLDLHQGIERATFIDSSNLYIHFIDAIYLLDPSAKFILLVRNGKDFVRSAHSRGWHEHNQCGTVPPHDDPYFSRWNSMTPLQKNAWIWVYRNGKALQGLKKVPEENKMILKIEDIKKEDTHDRLEVFSGIKLNEAEPSERINANPSFDLPPKEEWSEGMNKDFEGIAGEMMRFLGYI